MVNLYFRYNKPIVSTITLISVTLLFIGSGLTYCYMALKEHNLERQFWVTWCLDITFKSILPILVVLHHERLKSYIERLCKRYINILAIRLRETKYSVISTFRKSTQIKVSPENTEFQSPSISIELSDLSYNLGLQNGSL